MDSVGREVKIILTSDGGVATSDELVCESNWDECTCSLAELMSRNFRSKDLRFYYLVMGRKRKRRPIITQ